MSQKKIDEILDKLYTENPNILAIILASKNGLLINTRPTLYDCEDIGGKVAAMSTTILGAAEMLSAIRIPLAACNRRAGAIGGGILQEVILTSRHMQMVVIGAGPQNLLFVDTNKSEIGEVLLQEIRNSAREIAKEPEE